MVERLLKEETPEAACSICGKKAPVPLDGETPEGWEVGAEGLPVCDECARCFWAMFEDAIF